MHIVNPESFVFDQDELKALRDLCRLASYFGKETILADVGADRQRIALALADKMLSVPFVIIEHEDMS